MWPPRSTRCVEYRARLRDAGPRRGKSCSSRATANRPTRACCCSTYITDTTSSSRLARRAQRQPLWSRYFWVGTLAQVEDRGGSDGVRDGRRADGERVQHAAEGAGDVVAVGAAVARRSTQGV